MPSSSQVGLFQKATASVCPAFSKPSLVYFIVEANMKVFSIHKEHVDQASIILRDFFNRPGAEIYDMRGAIEYVFVLFSQWVYCKHLTLSSQVEDRKPQMLEICKL